MRTKTNGKFGLIVSHDPRTGRWGATHRNFFGDVAAFARRRRLSLIARSAFPNDTGNYRGKRTPRPVGKPLTPRERFARLAAHFLAARMSYRNPPHNGLKQPVSFFFWWLLETRHLLASIAPRRQRRRRRKQQRT